MVGPRWSSRPALRDHGHGCAIRLLCTATVDAAGLLPTATVAGHGDGIRRRYTVTDAAHGADGWPRTVTVVGDGLLHTVAVLVYGCEIPLRLRDLGRTVR